MAITAMDMAHKYTGLLGLFFIIPCATAGVWDISPAISLDSIHTDNVNLDTDNKESSWVNQSNVLIDGEYRSRVSSLNFKAKTSYASFSHDSSLDDQFSELQASGTLSLWDNALKVIATSSIENQSQNESQNSLADIVSNDTIQVKQNSAGLTYSLNNADINLSSSLIYNLFETEDGIGESNGYTALLNAGSGQSARHIFWQISNTNSKRTSQSEYGKTHRQQAKMGWINSSPFIPLLSYSDESATGTIAASTNQLTAWGPGVKWEVTPKLILEVIYNYVEDKSQSDDYISTSIEWQPSIRTSLTASHSQRFFGDSYSLSFSHRARRLTNNITYTDSVSSFERGNGFKIQGYYWCPADVVDEAGNIDDLSLCQLSSTDQAPLTLARKITANTDSTNQFVINKALSWQSTLAFSRTTLSFMLSQNDTEYRSTEQQSKQLTASLTVNRKVSRRSTLSLSSRFQQNEISFQNNNLVGQKDYYRVLTLTYTKELARSMSAELDLNYTNRDSTSKTYTYDETRASFNIKKDF